MKKKKISTAKKNCWVVYSLYIRTRDCLLTTGCASWGLCITCERRYHIKLLQAGHFIAGRNNAILFNERATHAQCYNCNINLKGNTLEYRRQIIKLYGKGVDWKLECQARQHKKFTVLKLEKMTVLYKNKLTKMN